MQGLVSCNDSYYRCYTWSLNWAYTEKTKTNLFLGTDNKSNHPKINAISKYFIVFIKSLAQKRKKKKKKELGPM